MDFKFCNGENSVVAFCVETMSAMFLHYLLMNPKKAMTNKTIRLGNIMVHPNS